MSASGTLTQSDTFKWKIPEFLKKLYSVYITSQEFSVTDLDDKSGNCSLLISNESPDHVGIFLQNKSSNVLNLSFHFSIEDKEGINKKISSYKCEFDINKALGFPKFFALDELKQKSSKILSGGELTVVLEIDKPGIKSPIEILTKHLEELLLDTEFTDIKILCQDEVFPCHRNLLASRSPVLKIMCLQDFKEGVTGEINLDCMEPLIVKVKVIYFYFCLDFASLEWKILD
jgi:hypothetical protein